MSVVLTFRVDSGDFLLGRVIPIESPATIELETVAPVGIRLHLLIWYLGEDDRSFLESLSAHQTVTDVVEYVTSDAGTLYRLEWESKTDRLLHSIVDHRGYISRGIGDPDRWEFEACFPTTADLSACNDYCRNKDIPIEVIAVNTLTEYDPRVIYGLTNNQQEALQTAVRNGYYDIPRQCSTEEIAQELGISDQAMIERLRRGIDSLVRNTLLK